jgi:hypothetical protein
MMRDIFDIFQERARERFGDGEVIRGNDSVRSDLVDLALNLKCDKPLSIAVTDPAGAQSKWIWLPKSQIEYEAKGRGVVIVSLPQWLAQEKGLI